MVEEFLEELTGMDPEQVRAKLAELMPEYRPWDYLSRELDGSGSSLR